MKSKNISLSALCLSVGLFAIPAVRAGDGPGAPSSRCSAPVHVYPPLYGHRVSSQCACCDRRCARLTRMLQKRGCSCPEVARALQPVRSHTYLSAYYPPYRYGR